MMMNPRLTLTKTSKKRTPTILMKMIWVSHHGDDDDDDEDGDGDEDEQEEGYDDINNSNNIDDNNHIDDGNKIVTEKLSSRNMYFHCREYAAETAKEESLEEKDKFLHWQKVGRQNRQPHNIIHHTSSIY